MIPRFLEEFKDKLEKFKLESIKIKATPINEEENLTFTQSKFLGKPYLPISIDYPKDKMGNPMILLAQINFAETPHLENYPYDGILQFFISSTEWYDMDDYKILFHPIIENEYQTDFSFLTEKLYEESPVYCEHKLAFEKVIEYGGYEDFRFDMDFNGDSYYDYQEKLTDEQLDRLGNVIDLYEDTLKHVDSQLEDMKAVGMYGTDLYRNKKEAYREFTELVAMLRTAFQTRDFKALSYFIYTIANYVLKGE